MVVVSVLSRWQLRLKRDTLHVAVEIKPATPDSNPSVKRGGTGASSVVRMSQSVPTGLKEGYRPILSAGIPRPGAPSLSGRTRGTSSVWSLRVESDLGFPEGKTQPRHSGTLIQSLGATFLVSGDPKRISTNFGGTWPDPRGGRWAQPSPNSETPAEALSRGR